MSTHLFYGAEDGETKVCLPSFLGGDTADHASAVLERLLHMESTLVAKD